MFYAVGVTEDMVVFTEEPKWIEPKKPSNGRPQKRPRLAKNSPRPISLKDLSRRIPLRRCTWREGTKGKLSGHFAWMRVWSAQGWATGECAGEPAIWLLIEKQSDGKIKYAFSNLPVNTSCIEGVRFWKSRWPVEQGYQQMKEELGLDHFEGRRWIGFHHHACLVFLAYGFLMLERHRLRHAFERRRREKNSATEPVDLAGDSQSAADPSRTAS